MPNLLVIDDDADMLSSLMDVLSTAGYQVSSVSSGDEALTAAEHTSPDLVISDVRMAGMDGIECIERLSLGRPNLKSIVITGYASDDIPSRAMDLATCDYLRKPFTAEQLIQSVSRALAPPVEIDQSGPQAVMQQTAAALQDLEQTRRRAFQNYYLGVRSGHLGATAALAIWDLLESLELRRLELERQLQLRLEVTALKDGYLSASELCKSRSTPVTPAEKRSPAGISRVGFQPFFKNIRDGKISIEQVKTAATVRKKFQEDPESPDSREIYNQVWN